MGNANGDQGPGRSGDLASRRSPASATAMVRGRQSAAAQFLFSCVLISSHARDAVILFPPVVDLTRCVAFSLDLWDSLVPKVSLFLGPVRVPRWNVGLFFC